MWMNYGTCNINLENFEEALCMIKIHFVYNKVVSKSTRKLTKTGQILIGILSHMVELQDVPYQSKKLGTGSIPVPT